MTLGVPTAHGVAFHFCPVLGGPPACGLVPAAALLAHVALPAADVAPELRCRRRACRTAYETLDQQAPTPPRMEAMRGAPVPPDE